MIYGLPIKSQLVDISQDGAGNIFLELTRSDP